ncbi:hypothetical protein C5167_021560 [Papaver somniferum]|uniref:serine/threonine-protein kinase rio2-like n=1 Tax=Papaver somniferum TaxID=3469 RepID=UPI000E6F47F8|nr:serine/threonine-protein kinase rio2-like [Papaver somniferum]RZC91849.1 hypothetical protein C5167_021560 [Papaver somniferum]
MSISANEFLGENDDDNSDSDTNNLDDDGPDYYQPISTDDDEDVDHGFQMISSNGHIEPEIGIHTLDLNHEEEEETIEDEEEEEEASNSEISRAFIEDENRRNAPLTPENSNRIMNAMRGISFQAGFVPDWINQVPDDRWIDHLTNLRQLQPNSTSTSSTTAAQN